MPRTVPSGLASHLAAESLNLATLVKITRLDGSILGFTTSDVLIVYSGLTYYPEDAVEGSVIESKAGTGADNMDFSGVLKSSRITEADIVGGKYDGARVEVFLINPLDIAGGAMTLLSGRMGEITQPTDGAWRAEVRSLSSLLKQAVGDTTTKVCRCRRLGDAQCKKSLAGNTVGGIPIQGSKTVHSVSGDGLTITFASDSAATGHYNAGLILCTSGANSGTNRECKSHTSVSGRAVIVLRRPFPLAVTAGETFTITSGCDRTFETCTGKYANGRNFHGEHYLPGNDQILKVGRPPTA